MSCGGGHRSAGRSPVLPKLLQTPGNMPRAPSHHLHGANVRSRRNACRASDPASRGISEMRARHCSILGAPAKCSPASPLLSTGIHRARKTFLRAELLRTPLIAMCSLLSKPGPRAISARGPAVCV